MNGRSAVPVSASVSGRMRRQPSRNTGTERALRSQLHRRGLRYRIHRRPVPGLRREADVVFGPVRLAVFVDGCFWHGCPEHGTWPKSNADFWRNKIDGNRVRDRDTDQRLRDEGWTVIRVWGHEDPTAAAARIEATVAQLRSLPAASSARAATTEA